MVRSRTRHLIDNAGEEISGEHRRRAPAALDLDPDLGHEGLEPGQRHAFGGQPIVMGNSANNRPESHDEGEGLAAR
jgi:hypothetical protein